MIINSNVIDGQSLVNKDSDLSNFTKHAYICFVCVYVCFVYSYVLTRTYQIVAKPIAHGRVPVSERPFLDRCRTVTALPCRVLRHEPLQPERAAVERLQHHGAAAAGKRHRLAQGG